MTRGLLAAGIFLLAASASAPARDADGIARFVEGLPDEAQECAFLRELCLGARYATSRQARTPRTADLLASRQGAIASAQARDAADAAAAIERKRGKRLPCFDEPVCRGLVPARR